VICNSYINYVTKLLFCPVISIDIDPKKIELARNNAKVYGVSDRIEFIIGDYYALAPTLKADVVYLAPPWGGPTYSLQKTYNIDDIMINYGGGKYLYEITRQITTNIAFFLPRNIDVNQVCFIFKININLELYLYKLILTFNIEIVNVDIIKEFITYI